MAGAPGRSPGASYFSAAAVGAGTEDGEMARVHGKAVLGGDAADGTFDDLHRHLFDATALAADEVEMVRVVGRVVGRRPVPEVGVRHEPELLEQLEGSVDRGDVHPAGGTTHALRDLVRRGMTECGYGLQDEL